jgi:hypothetical protein
MRLQISDLTTPRQWAAVTGFTQAQFEKLLVLFTQSYFEFFGHTVAERQAELEVTPSLTSEQDLLLFTLFRLKGGLTYDALGFVCGMDASNAKRNQQLGLEILERALSAAQCLPRREFKDAAEFAACLKNETTVIIDGLEQSMQRPNDDAVQRNFYSGKKCHAVKALKLCNPDKRILYLSNCWVGKTHDYAMFKMEFPPGQPWFVNLNVRLDLGFVGFEKKNTNARSSSFRIRNRRSKS